MHFRLRLMPLLLAVSMAACSNGTAGTDIPELPEVTPSEVRDLLAGSDRPIVLNVWASWCGPCRSEAPLLRRAHAEYDDAVRFVGIDVRDTQDGARQFIAEFGLDEFDHFFDGPGAVPGDLGGRGVPLTFFFTANGDLSHLHSGVIDERTLALQIDELLVGEG